MTSGMTTALSCSLRLRYADATVTQSPFLPKINSVLNKCAYLGDPLQDVNTHLSLSNSFTAVGMEYHTEFQRTHPLVPGGVCVRGKVR